jgi:hypothetical protein
VTKERLVTKQLIIGIFDPAFVQRLLRQIERVLDDRNPAINANAGEGHYIPTINAYLISITVNLSSWSVPFTISHSVPSSNSIKRPAMTSVSRS